MEHYIGVRSDFFERRTYILTGARNCVTELASELAEMDEFGRMGVKQQIKSNREEDGKCGWLKDMSKREARERLRESAVRMARDAGMTPSSAAFRAIDIRDENNKAAPSNQQCFPYIDLFVTGRHNLISSATNGSHKKIIK